jgi:putative iron-dependent peroxidase
MLSRMFGTSDDGLRDRLTDFSRPVSGAYYFAPPLNLLADLPRSAGLDEASTADR